jgi:hypothetical protein
MNLLLPRKFTSLSEAIEYASSNRGIVYGFGGSIYKVYVGNCPQPIGVSAVWSAMDIDNSILIEWLNAI